MLLDCCLFPGYLSLSLSLLPPIKVSVSWSMDRYPLPPYIPELHDRIRLVTTWVIDLVHGPGRALQ